MKSLNSTPCRGFVLCTGSMTADDGFTHPNTGAGMVNQLIYIYKGGVIATAHDGTQIPLSAGNVYDVSQYADTPIKYWAGNDGCQYIAIDPVPNNKRFDYELVRGEENKTVVGSLVEQIIFCVEGTITCNDTELKSTQYAPVAYGKTVNVSVPANAVMVILTAR
jgi:hypothetical protein